MVLMTKELFERIEVVGGRSGREKGSADEW
jgi:hypothetical protein